MVEGLQEEGRKKKHHPSIPTCPQKLGKGFGKSQSQSHCLMSGTKETGINMAGEEEGKEPGVWHDGPTPVGSPTEAQSHAPAAASYPWLHPHGVLFPHL